MHHWAPLWGHTWSPCFQTFPFSPVLHTAARLPFQEPSADYITARLCWNAISSSVSNQIKSSGLGGHSWCTLPGLNLSFHGKGQHLWMWPKQCLVMCQNHEFPSTNPCPTPEFLSVPRKPPMGLLGSQFLVFLLSTLCISGCWDFQMPVYILKLLLCRLSRFYRILHVSGLQGVGAGLSSFILAPPLGFAQTLHTAQSINSSARHSLTLLCAWRCVQCFCALCNSSFFFLYFEYLTSSSFLKLKYSWFTIVC